MLAGGTPRRDEVQATVYATLREAFLTGVAVVVPLVISLYVLVVVEGMIAQALSPLVTALRQQGVPLTSSRLIVETIAVVFLLALTVVVGFFARFRSGQRALDYFDAAVEKLPGLGTIYKSFRKMSDVMLESDADNFREVKLVEFPMDEAYTLGFETTQTPEEIRAAAGRDDEMRTLFLPLAPNPVMGGFLAHVPEERILDVDMTVEEGLRTIVTTGVALGDTRSASLSRDELEELTGMDVVDTASGDGEGRA
ncbi:MAG: DUF502 domain-containing protein [Halobacteriaceae archaeon]